jgi:hypothetical protein
MAYGSYQSSKADRDSISTRRYLRLVSTGLKGLQSYLDWVPLPYVNNQIFLIFSYAPYSRLPINTGSAGYLSNSS